MAQADSRAHVDYEIKALQNGWNLREYTPGFDYITSAPSLAMEYYFAHKYYGLSEAEMNAGLERLRQTSNRSQLKKYLMQTALLQQYSANISGGSEKTDNYLSVMYEKSDEATIKRGYERFMLNYNSTYRFNKRITGSMAAMWQKRKRETSGATISDFAGLSPYELLKEENGSYAPNINIFNRFELEKIKRQDFPYEDFSYNLLREVENRSYKTDATHWRVQLGLNVKLLTGLTYDVKYQYERNRSEFRNLDGEETFAARYMANYYTAYNSATQTVGTSYLPAGAILRTGTDENRSSVLRNQLSYTHTIAKHDITALLGTEMSEYITKSVVPPTVFGYNPKTNTAKAPYYGSHTPIENLDNNSHYATLPEQGHTFADRTDRYLSYFFNAGYLYNQKYGLSYSVRYDGSNFVSKDRSLRWAPMWSVGGKWNLSQEAFMQRYSWIDHLTLRVTYGINGNAEKSTSPQTLISISPSAVTHGDIARITSYGNPTLRWERTYTTNIGLNFSLLKNKLSGKIDYYNRLSKDVVGAVTIPAAYGSTSQRFNNAEISNKGIELELTGHTDIRPIGLGIASTLTFAYNKNRIEKLYRPNVYSKDLVQGAFVEGKPIGALYSYRFAETQEGIPYVWGLNGKKSSMADLTLHNNTYGKDALTYEGTTIAPYSAGWGTQLTWNKLSLYILLTGKFGGVFRTPVAAPPAVGSSKVFIGSAISFLEQSDGSLWPTYPNKDDSNVYRWHNYMNYLSYFVEDASFVRLKEVSLSYRLPATWLRKAGVRQVKAFCQARDLGLLWAANRYDYDPEWLPGSNKPAASITLGINVNF